MPPGVLTCLPVAAWARLSRQHAERADALTAGHRARRVTGEKHPVEDFLFEYYGTRPSLLRRWHPGVGVALQAGPDGAPPQSSWRWYVEDPDGAVRLDVDAYLSDRATTVAFVHRLLVATASRPAFLGCFGLHEWAMVYADGDHRHPLPLRLGQEATDAVVEQHQIRCSHFDAYRFFTPPAVPLNRLRPTRSSQVDLEQPGCLHAGMDLHKWSLKLGPVVPGELALDCFQLAADIRLLDMQAAPYDLSAHGLEPVRIETPEGKAEYVSRQRGFSERSAALRARLVEVCESLRQTRPVATPRD